MSGARFTVVCPAYNRSAAISATIESVLGQTRGDFDLLVGSDGSTDDTDDIIAGYARSDRRVKLLVLPHTGDPGRVRSRLCRDVSSDYVAYIDHDDRWREDHLAVLATVLGGGASLAATGAEYLCDDGSAKTLRGRGLLWHPELAVVDPYAEPSRVAHRSGVLDPAGGWKRSGGGLEDWDLWWRMSSAGILLQPIDVPSAVVSISGSTRRNVLNHKMVLPLASTADEAAARAGAADLTGNGLKDILAGDFRRWSAEIDGDPQTVFPLPGRGFPFDISEPAPIPGTPVAGQPGTVFTVAAFPGGRAGWLVGLAAPYVSRSHGRCIDAVVRRRFPVAVAELGASLALTLPGAEPKVFGIHTSRRGIYE